MPTGRRAPHPRPVPPQCPLVKGAFVKPPRLAGADTQPTPSRRRWQAAGVRGHGWGGLGAQGPEEETEQWQEKRKDTLPLQHSEVVSQLPRPVFTQALTFHSCPGATSCGPLTGEARPPCLLPDGFLTCSSPQPLTLPGFRTAGHPGGPRMFFPRRPARWLPSQRARSHGSPLYLPFPTCWPSS